MIIAATTINITVKSPIIFPLIDNGLLRLIININNIIYDVNSRKGAMQREKQEISVLFTVFMSMGQTAVTMGVDMSVRDFFFFK